MRALLLTAAFCGLAVAARADAMADRLCPILDAVAASAGGLPEAVQAQLVVEVAGAYDYDAVALQDVLDNVDAATSAACPEARAAVLAAANKPDLAAAMR
jgi:hypothetical protein